MLLLLYPFAHVLFDIDFHFSKKKYPGVEFLGDMISFYIRFFQSWNTIFHNYQQYMRIPVASCCSRHLVLSVWFACFLFFFFFNWPSPEQAEVPRPGIESIPQQQPNLLQWKCWILNSLSHRGTLVSFCLKAILICVWWYLIMISFCIFLKITIISHPYIFFGEVPLLIFCSFFNNIICFLVELCIFLVRNKIHS